MTAPVEPVEVEAEPDAELDLEDDPQFRRARARLGTLLQDKWRLETLLGLGGMAAVYAATHRNGKRVAVKVLHEEFSHDEEVRKRFLHEGYAANTIQHEGAVSVLDDDVDPDGSAFLVMELLEGETVEQRWNRAGRHMACREVLWIADQILGVLTAAHAKSVVHRDIKPDNLFLTTSGSLKVLDFGIAKVFERRESRTTATRAGVIMGTPAFMAPEQARARWDEVDGRTDLWAVGATMFTLLTGCHVHESPSSHEQLILSATTPAKPLAHAAPGLPSHVGAIIDRALAFDRALRWEDARSMQRAVRESMDALGDERVERPASSARPPSRSFGGEPGDASVFVAAAATAGEAPATGVRETRLAEVQRLRSLIRDVSKREADARDRMALLQSAHAAEVGERTALESWFERRVGSRAAAVDEARAAVRQRLAAIGQQATDDLVVFGDELKDARLAIAALGRAAVAAQRDLAVHEAALTAYDPRAFRRGVAVLILLALGVMSALGAPVAWRAFRVIDPPPATAPRH